MNENAKVARLPSKLEALVPIIFLLAIMVPNYVFGWGQDPHISVTLSCGAAMIIGRIYGYTCKDVLAAGLGVVNQSLEAIIIVLLVGCLTRSFTACGTIPTVVYYGLKLLSPGIFLPFITLMYAVVGITLGSAWTVSTTPGIAFMTIGKIMGLNPALIAGVILSRACCGGKFSPLPDSTSLAAEVSQTGLFDHVEAMVTTTFLGLVIAIIIHAFLSFSSVNSYDPTLADNLSAEIVNHYNYMSPLLLIPILMIIIAAVIKMPAIPSIILLSLVGCIFAVVLQGAEIADCIRILHYGYSAESRNGLFYTLANRRGMGSMLWINSLVVVAVAFGGILQKIGAVESILSRLINKIRTPFQLVFVTLITSIFCTTTIYDQYLGLIIPPSMYKNNYNQMGLGRNILSRTLKDGGTLWSPLVPWSSCGSCHASVLGVPTLSYLPYYFMNLINPIFTLVITSWGGNILSTDGSRTTFYGKLKKGRGPAGASGEAHEITMKALVKRRKAGVYKSL